MAVCVVYIGPFGGNSSVRPCDGRVLSLCMVARGTRSAKLFLDSLNFAFYSKSMTVELFFVVPQLGEVISPPLLWLHGRIHPTDQLPPNFDYRSNCIVVLEDSMEVSPVFSYWFAFACGRSVVSGGETGLAVPGDVWTRFVQQANLSSANVTGELLRFIAAQNLTIIHPELDEGYTFVRARRQDPLQPELRPKLVRSMDERLLHRR
jgi:hypothetical protein